MKKKLISIILCLVIILSAILLVGCNNTSDTDKPPTDLNTQDEYPKTTNTTNFLSLSTTTYQNINDKDVTVDLFYNHTDEKLNNPNMGQALLLAQAIKYKLKYPEREVNATMTSFHWSVILSACVDKNSKYYGYMRSMWDKDYDEDGFVRISYLCVYAAKIGINMTVVGQIDGGKVYKNGVKVPDLSFVEYFESFLDQDSDIEGKKIGDFMTFREACWTSYGDKSSTDMMHIKTCTVSNYIDKDGKEHSGSFWVGSINLDGIHENGANGNNSIQSAAIVSDHDELYNIIRNYTLIMVDYCGQEQMYHFRDKIKRMNAQQIDLISSGREDEIPEGEQIVYLGTAKDKIFEFYFSPIGSSTSSWDTVYDPYGKYLSKLLTEESKQGAITFAWNNVKFRTGFTYSSIIEQMMLKAFTENNNVANKLYLRLPGLNTGIFNNLVVGQNIGAKMINETVKYANHTKDFQLSYLENGERQYVTVLNTLNFHQGAAPFQVNSFLVIKETKATGNNVYVEFGRLATYGIINESDRVMK